MNFDFTTIDALKTEWDALQPLSPENRDRLWKKLRLEWNYNSNHIEGNTLTYGETELLLIHDRTTGDHQLRDYMEMKAHDVGIAHIRELASEERILAETDVRDLNRIILKEPFWKEAITGDGQPTRKHVIPGAYKTTPNNVRTATGEIFAFASPAETPSRMSDLITWLRQALESEAVHPIELIARLHHEFVLIHPFDDGNGRVARLLINYVLLRLGFPPLIIKTADKSGYLTALRKADAGDLPAFTRYLAEQAEWSLRLGIRAARGQSIEEPSDVEKELAIFIRDQRQHQDRVKRRSPEALKELFELCWRNLFERFETKISKLYPLFAEHSLTASPALEGATDWSSALKRFVSEETSSDVFQVKARLRGYRGRSKAPFDMQAGMSLVFHEFDYQVVALGQPVSTKPYSEPVLSDEADTITVNVLKQLFEQIKKQSGQS